MKIYPKGVIAFKPHEKAPKFVIATVVINPKELAKWLVGEGAESLTDGKYGSQLKLQIAEFDGKFTISVDNWKKPTEQVEVQKKEKDEEVNEEMDDLPF
jgi:hypothetical protein